MIVAELYNLILPLWGTGLRFADGILLEHKNPFKALGQLKGQYNDSASNEHFYSETFSKSWQQAGELIDKNDELQKLMLWSMYQVFHRHAARMFSEGETALKPSQVPFAEVKIQFEKNLNEPGYEVEKQAYEQS